MASGIFSIVMGVLCPLTMIAAGIVSLIIGRTPARAFIIFVLIGIALGKVWPEWLMLN